MKQALKRSRIRRGTQQRMYGMQWRIYAKRRPWKSLNVRPFQLFKY